MKFEAALRLTLPQLLCVASDKPPGARAKMGSYEEYQAALEARAAADEAWSRP